MYSQSHVLLASALLGRRVTAREDVAILIGAIIPDLSIFVFAAFGGLIGMSSEEMWARAYWSEPWQSLSAISNSFPLWLAAMAVCAALRARLGVLICAAAVLHLGFDLPLHAADAHKHFWPLSDVRIHSPVSYWDRDHYGAIVGPIESCVGLMLCAVLWRRHRTTMARFGIAVCAAAYLLAPVFWIVSLGDQSL